MARKRKARLTWKNIMMTADFEVKTYSFRASFGAGDFIEHTSFGKGYVTSVQDNKIAVLFEDKSRTLVHKIDI